ncbi:hypothetical protein BKA63DRAFT_579897 [Paraphoma chrysanthemicola]|nr:hypothetical protein BKA63DRAFT_579897 [Paraphoma chrysanthemicola]
MADSNLLVVVGITGNQGSSVAASLLNVPGWRIRGITRNPTSSTAQAWHSKGVEIIKADLNDIASLELGFSGASAIFAVTDFWSHFRDPANTQKAKEAGLSVNEYARNLEIAQGMNMALAASGPAVLSTLTHYIFSTLSDTKRWSQGKYTWNFHFDGKASITQRIQAELPVLAAKLSTIQVGIYTTNWKLGMGQPLKQSDGSFLVPVPAGDNVQVPWIVVGCDTGVFVKALLQHAPGKHVLGFSEMASYGEFWKLWAEIQGVKAEIMELPLDEHFKRLPEPMRKEIQESLCYIREFGYTGGDPKVVTLADLEPGAKTTSLKEYIATEDWSSILT